MGYKLKSCPLCGGDNLKTHHVHRACLVEGVVKCLDCNTEHRAALKLSDYERKEPKEILQLRREALAKACSDWNTRIGRTCKLNKWNKPFEKVVDFIGECSNCGTAIMANDNFCADCGAKIVKVVKNE